MPERFNPKRKRYSKQYLEDLVARATAERRGYERLRDEHAKINRAVLSGSLPAPQTCPHCGGPLYEFFDLNRVKCPCFPPEVAMQELEVVRKERDHIRYLAKTKLSQREARKSQVIATLGRGLYWRSWFRTYQPATESQQNAIDAIRAFDGNSNQWCMVLAGETGVGKSHLLAAKFKQMVIAGAAPRWSTEDAIYRKWLGASSFESADRESRLSLIESLSDGVLFIDDLGVTTAGREGWNTTLASILCEREARGALTFISTNLTANEVATTYSARVASRLAAGKCLRIVAEDWRRVPALRAG